MFKTRIFRKTKTVFYSLFKNSLLFTTLSLTNENTYILTGRRRSETPPLLFLQRNVIETNQISGPLTYCLTSLVHKHNPETALTLPGKRSAPALLLQCVLLQQQSPPAASCRRHSWHPCGLCPVGLQHWGSSNPMRCRMAFPARLPIRVSSRGSIKALI